MALAVANHSGDKALIEQADGTVCVAHDEDEVAEAEDGFWHTRLFFLALEKTSNHGNKNQTTSPPKNHLKPIYEP